MSRYFISCISASFLSHHLGLRWSLVVAAVNMGTGCLILSRAPPYGLFIFCLALLGFGGGIYDACLTTVVSHEEDGVLMSFMYAAFGVRSTASIHVGRANLDDACQQVGAMISPLLIGGLIDRGVSWNVCTSFRVVFIRVLTL